MKCDKCGSWVGFDTARKVYFCMWCKKEFEQASHLKYVGKDPTGVYDHYIGDWPDLLEGQPRSCVYAYILDLLHRTAERGLEGPTLDVGGYHGPYRTFFKPPHDIIDYWKNRVEPDGIIHAEDASYGTVLSTESLEHFENPIVTFCEMARVLKPGGHLILTVPMYWGYHPDPKDCWRILPDGMAHMITLSKLETLELNFMYMGDTCSSVHFVGRKPL